MWISLKIQKKIKQFIDNKNSRFESCRMYFNSEDLDNESTLYADGFEKAFLGHISIFNKTIACYDINKCIEILIEDNNMSQEEAVEYLDFNVLGAYVGEHTPAFLYPK